MTSIKPPALPTPTATDLSVGPSAASASAPSAVRGELSEALAGVGSFDSKGAVSAASAARAESIEQLTRELEAGRLSADQALERLVERMAVGLEHSLAPEERAELLDVLRAALATDPTLSALRDALG